MIRLVIVVDTLSVGGAQRLIASLIEALNPREIEATVVSLSSKDSPVIVDALRAIGVRIEKYPSNSLLDLKRLWRLICFFWTEKFDLIHTHLTYSNILGCLSGFFSGIPVIVTLHSVASEPSRFSRQLKNLEEVIVRKLAVRIIAVGFAVADANRSRFAGRAIDIIPNGIPILRPLPSDVRRKIRSEFSDDETCLVVISVGRFVEAKGYEDMVDAFRIVHERNPATILILVGTGSMFDQIKAKISDIQLDDSIICLGERGDVPSLLLSSDIYVSSSHREGLPVAILEAMMAGLPIVSTSVGDIPYVVTEDLGYLVSPHDPNSLAEMIIELIKSPARIQAMGNAARARAVEEFSIDVWMAKLMSMYKETLAIKE